MGGKGRDLGRWAPNAGEADPPSLGPERVVTGDRPD